MTTATQERRASRARGIRTAARGLLIYGLLLGGAVVFSLPFLWMIGASFKLDREMFTEKITLFPNRPVPALQSPYLDPRCFRAPDDSRFRQVSGLIRQNLAQRRLPIPEGTANAGRAVDILTPGIFERLRAVLPTEVWTAPPERLAREIEPRVSDEMLAETTDKALRRLTFGSVRVRSLDLQEEDVTAGRPLSDFLTVECSGGARARLNDRAGEPMSQADLACSFSRRGKQSIRLSSAFALPFPAERLFRVQISIMPDDSWHAMRFVIEKNWRLYRCERAEYLGDYRWQINTLQERGPDDRVESNKIRFWNPYDDAGPGGVSDPDKIKLTLVIEKNSAPGAWYAKCERNYRGALSYIPFWRYAATSAFLAILNILGSIFACSLVAYSFARLQWPGRGFSFGLMLATMMIPPQVTMIPYFLIIKHLGWYNTLNPLWVISLFGNAFNIFLLRQFMKGIPRDLEDAAKIDGCSFLQIYWRVIMPLIKPTLACIAIFTFMGVWNDFMGPLIYLSDQRLYPLSLGLYAFNVQAGGNYGMMMAGSLLMTLPVVVIFFFAQKYFIQGVTLTGMKG